MSNVAKIITESILKRMEDAEQNGEVFRWVKPWNSGLDRAYSYDTLMSYRGVNRLLLDNNEHLTFNKMQEINQKKKSPDYQIRKGARSNIVCYINNRLKKEYTKCASLLGNGFIGEIVYENSFVNASGISGDKLFSLNKKSGHQSTLTKLSVGTNFPSATPVR